MSYLDDDGLFGHDMRHKPPRSDLLTARSGWGNSHGRLAYSNIVRSREDNMSEYALKILGGVLNGYVIVNAKAIAYCTETAFKVAHGRVAIPVKEYARQHMLTIKEQWELMHPQWVGTYFGAKEDYFRKIHPNLKDAISEAINAEKYDTFTQQFWTFDKALVEDDLRELQQQADALREQMMSLRVKASKMENDLMLQRLEEYHLDGLNAHEHLHTLRCELAYIEKKYYETRAKSDEIEQFIKERTFQKREDYERERKNAARSDSAS